MIRTEITKDGRFHTWSNQYMKIEREDGAIYDDAVDVIEHTYTETDIPIESDEQEVDLDGALHSLERLGVYE